MTWVVPSAADLKAAQPGFAAVDDAVVADALEMAEQVVPQTIPSQILFKKACIFYACHELTLDGHGTGAEAEMAAAGTLGMSSVSDGSVSFSRQSHGDKDADPIMSTTFGRRYLQIRNRGVVPFGVLQE